MANGQERKIEPNLIDTHCHLEMDAYNPDRESVIQRARDAGIEVMITIGSDLKGNLGGLELSQKYDFIYSSVGFHPHDAKDFTEEIFDQIKTWAAKYGIQDTGCRMQDVGYKMQAVTSPDSAVDGEIPPLSPPLAKGGMRGGKVVAIGEIGLDYHYDHSPREVQREVFLKQLRFAEEVDLPVIIHSREAKKDTLDIIEKSGIRKGVFHCFSGDMETAGQAIKMGFYISIAGPVTFKNSKRLREVAKSMPDNLLLIETDAPYLSPEPFRGKRNEPSFLVHTAKTIAELRGVSIEDVARITTLNAKRLFGLGMISKEGEIAYRIRDSLYLNITNRCTNRCSFCIRFYSDYVKGHNLRLSEEPTEEEIKHAICDPSRYKEIVFCGYGEPLLRLDLLRNIAAWIKQNNGKVRINTNGHGNLIHGRNILPELNGIVDRISISLDAHNEETYNRICKPSFRNAFQGILDFIRESRKFIPEVQITVIAIEGVDVGKCRKIAEELGVDLRVRELDIVG